MSDDPPYRLVEAVKYRDEVPGAQYPEHTWGGQEHLVDPLVDVLRSFDDPDGRANAAKALGYVGAPATLDPLRESAVEDPDPEVRRAAVWGLRWLGSAAAVPTLREIALGDGDGDVRWQAGRALAMIEWDDRPADGGAADHGNKPDCAAELLRADDDRAWEGFARELEHDHAPGREAVARRLERMLAADPEPRVLARLLEAVGSVDSRTDRIAAHLDHERPAVRAAAVEALRGRGDAPLDRLLSVAREDPDPEVRAAAVDTYAQTVDGQRTPLSTLAPFLEDDAPGVRAAAAHAIRFADPAESVPTLIEALEDPAPEVRVRAAWALKVVGLPRAVPGLIEAYPDDDPQVRENLVRALQWIAGDKGQGDAPGFSLLGDGTAPAVDGSGTRSYDPGRALDVLETALHDPAKQISWDAAHALADADHPDAAAVLADCAAGDAPAEVRTNAVYFLKRYPHVEASVEAYRTALADDDPAVRAAAVGIARGMNRDDTTRVLVEALEDDAPEVRVAAAEEACHHDDEAVTRALRERLAAESSDRVEFYLRRALGDFSSTAGGEG